MSDVLVVVSKIKKHVKENHELRTSEEAIHALSSMVEEALRTGATNARQDGRKTIAARDLDVLENVTGGVIVPGDDATPDFVDSL